MSYKESYRNEKMNKKKKGFGKKAMPTQSIFPIAMFLLCFFVVFCLIFFNREPKEKDIINTASLTSSSASSSISRTHESQTLKEIDGYSMITMSISDLSVGDLVLINNENIFARDVKDELKSLYFDKKDCYSVSNAEVVVQGKLIEPLNKMLLGFYNKTGNSSINITSGYRSEEVQKRLFDREVEQKGYDEAIHWVAKPSYSEHHAGYAIDINILGNDGLSLEYTGEGEYARLNETAPDYGFIVRYKEEKKDITGIYYEPWHFRYVGLPHSKIMQEKNMCFEEYISYLRGFTPDGDPLKYSHSGKTYEIYYCKGLNVYVPNDGRFYEISGNNVDGFIVTVTN